MGNPRPLILASAVLFSGCSALQTQEINLRDNLANRGPVSLSKSNPYIASNILLSKEVESNSTLKGFLKVRGNPDAVEVKKVLLRPYLMYFFYVANKEVYILEEANRDWIIRGPQSIPEPVLEVLEVLVPKKESDPQGETSTGIELESSAIVIERQSEIPDEGAEIVKPMKSEALPAPQTNTPAKEVATDTVEADIIHKVKFGGETLRLISEWYTGKAETAGRIARINGMGDANVLVLDQTIRIPRYLVTNATPLTKDRVEKYKAGK